MFDWYYRNNANLTNNKEQAVSVDRSVYRITRISLRMCRALRTRAADGMRIKWLCRSRSCCATPFPPVGVSPLLARPVVRCGAEVVTLTTAVRATLLLVGGSKQSRTRIKLSMYQRTVPSSR